MEFLKSNMVRFGLLILVVVVPGLLLTNLVLLEVRGLKRDVQANSAVCAGFGGLSFGLPEEATPTPTLKTKALGPTGPTKAVPVEEVQ